MNKILGDREKRYHLQQDLLKKYGKIITFSLTPPGNVKNSVPYLRYFNKARYIFEHNFSKFITQIKYIEDNSGYQSIYSIEKGRIEDIKRKFIIFEQKYLFEITDIDIITVKGPLKRSALGVNERKCIFCKKAFRKVCMTRKEHSVKEVSDEYGKRMGRLENVKKYEKMLNEIMARSLLIELGTTPKYGMVDLLDNGIHKDMDLKMFIKAINVIKSNMGELFRYGFYEYKINRSSLKRIRNAGLPIEKKMLKANNGVNTLKGAIFLYCIIFYVLGYLFVKKEKLFYKDIISSTKRICKDLTDELSDPILDSYSRECYLRYNVGGIREELENGLEIIFMTLKEGFNYSSINELALRRFLYLFKNTNDTQVIKRTGIKHYRKMQESLDPFNIDLMYELDKYKNHVDKFAFSAGGTADLLSLTFFFEAITDVVSTSH